MEQHNNTNFEMDVDTRAASQLKPAEVSSFVSKGRFSSWYAGTPPGSPLRLHPCLLHLSSPSYTQYNRELKGGMGVSHAGSVAFNSPYLQFFVREVLSQLFGNSFQVFEWDFARLVVIKQPESFQDLLFGVLLSLKSGENEYCDNFWVLD